MNRVFHWIHCTKSKFGCAISQIFVVQSSENGSKTTQSTMVCTAEATQGGRVSQVNIANQKIVNKD